MRAIVLGATGFIGGQIARCAHEAGMDVHGLRRRAGAVGAIGDVPVIWHEGNLDDEESLTAAMRGCDVLFHAAGYYPPGTERSVRRAVRLGASEMRRVLGAARAAGVRRVVYTSSLTTIGAPPKGSGRLADERNGYLPGSTRNPYYEAKWAMEHEALRAAQDGLSVIILCPTAVFGPGDVKPTTGKIMLMVAKGQLPMGVDVEANVVDGRDVAQAHVQAATHGAPGERTLIGGYNVNVADALREAARVLGVKAPGRTLSVRTAARLLSIADVLRLPIDSTMRALPHWTALNCEKGQQMFGLTPRPFEDTVRDTVAWFREHGYL
jgi:dihydroflavonol-4-reductase